MAVEYDISSDVAVIKETGSVSQCARVTQMYSGQITYDDEAGSKFATATINGKSQRVMLCIAVSGTVTYDDVPSLYSTVDGHRCLNIVTPTETGTPDDVPSLYETVVIDGQNVRAVRCIMINKTPVYDGVSSTCTFTGDDGKTHTAQLVNKITGGSTVVIIKGTSPLVLPDAIANSLSYVKAFGGTEQRNLPDGYTQFGRIYLDGNCYFDTGVVINSLAATVKLIAAFDSQTSSSPCIMWGYMGSDGNLPRWGAGLYSGKWLTSANGTAPYGTADTDKHIFIAELYDNSGTSFWRSYIDGALLGNGVIASSETITGNTLSTYIGARNNNGTAGNYIKGNFTYLEITQDGVCLAKIYPCKRDSDNVLGLYNTVTNEFLPNLGTGTLTADIFATPSPSEPIDIVSNNGVLKVSPNLFNKATISKYTLINSTTGNTYSAPDEWSWCSDYIPVSPDTTYYFMSGANWNVRIFEYTSNQSYTNRNYVVLNTSFTTGSTTAYVRFHIGAATGGRAMYEGETMLSLGSTALPYHPYVEGGIYADGTVETIQTQHQLELPTTNTYGNITDTYTYSYNANADTVAVPVTIGKQYIIEWTDTTQSTVGTVFGYGFVGDSTPSGQAVTQGYRGTIQGLPSNPIIVTADNSYLLLQCNQNYTAPNITNGYLTVAEADTAIAEMLLKVGNYQDEQEILSGVVTRNVGVKALDGTEDWGASGTYTGSCYTQLSSATTGAYVPILVTHFMAKTSEGSYSVGSALYNRRNFSLWLSNSTTPTTLKSWLAQQYAAGTPVIIVYPLATSTTESVTGQPLQVQAGDNVLEITQAGMDGLELEAQYNAAVELTIQEVQDANLDNNVEVTIN